MGSDMDEGLGMSPADAVMAQARAARHREMAKEFAIWGDLVAARFEAAEAEGLEQAAAQALDPQMHVAHSMTPGLGGEMVARSKANLRKSPGLVDTPTTRPDMATADASLERLRLAADAGVLTLGADMAETIQAGNSAERALAHQLAAAHRVSMMLLCEAGEDVQAYRNGGRFGQRHTTRIVEACRSATAAARLMDSFQRGLLALERLRNGGQQLVTGQHVNVGNGGRAVVAGSVQQGSKGT